MCPHGHDWTITISNFDFGSRCSVCSRRKKYALEEVQGIFAKEGYLVQDSIYINGKTPIQVTCSNGHETAISLNNFLNGRQCGECGRRKATEARMKKLEMKTKSVGLLPPCEASRPLYGVEMLTNNPDALVKQEWLAKLDEMRKNLKSSKRLTYRE